MDREADTGVLSRWGEIEELLGGAEAIDALARAHGAFKRPRVVKDGAQLLRLVLGYAGSGHSLRTTAAWSGAELKAELSDVALLGRFREAGDFLAALVQDLLARLAKAAEPSPAWSGPVIRLVDGSVLQGPGRKGGRHRLHASFDPVRQIFTALDLTGIDKGESLLRLNIEPGAIAVADRNYAKTHVLRELAENGSFFVLRAGMRSMRLIAPDTGERVTSQDVLAALGDGQACELAVSMIEAGASKSSPKQPMQARLVILRASEAVTKHELARIKRSRRTHKATPTQETQDLAGVVMLITNLPIQAWPIDKISALYKLRWQIELAFKILKSLFEMRVPPANEPRLARSWILANLILALLATLLAAPVERAIPPSAQ